MPNPTNPGGIVGTISQIFSGIGQSLNQQTQAAADAATQGFYVIAGELAVIILLLAGMFVVQISRRN